MSEKLIALVVAAALAACGGELQVGGGMGTPGVTAPSTATTTAEPVAAPIAPSMSPQIEIREPGAAIVGGKRIPFDGIVEGLMWPALMTALPRAKGDTSPIVIQAGREVPIVHVLRAAWTLRAADVRVQTLDEKGVLYAIELKAKRERPAASPDAPKLCHLAVFLLPTGALRIATPAGPQEIGGDRPAESLAESLQVARAECKIKYVAFGAETTDVPWGPVFDIMVVVDRKKAAGDARYVLGEAIQVVKAPPAPSASAHP